MAADRREFTELVAAKLSLRDYVTQDLPDLAIEALVLGFDGPATRRL